MTPEPVTISTRYAGRAARQGWSAERDERVAEHYRKGLTAHAIADATGISKHSVRSIIERLILRRVLVRRP